MDGDIEQQSSQRSGSTLPHGAGNSAQGKTTEELVDTVIDALKDKGAFPSYDSENLTPTPPISNETTGLGYPTDENNTSHSNHEKKETREEVLEAFNEAYEYFMNYPEEKLSPAQLSDRDYLREVKEATLDKNKSYRNIRIVGDDGFAFPDREYIPVDALENFLWERVRSGELSGEETQKYMEIGRILKKNDVEYFRNKNHPRRTSQRALARVAHERKRIEADPRIASGDLKEDQLLAGTLLNRRRELELPKQEKKKDKDDFQDRDGDHDREKDQDRDHDRERDQERDENRDVPPPPPPPEIREILIANRTTDLQKRARELAEQHLREEQRRGSALNPRNWARKTRTRVLEEYYRQKYIQEAMEHMIENNNTYLSLDIFTNAASEINHRREEEMEAGKSKLEEIRTGENTESQQVVEITGELKNIVFDEIIVRVMNREITSLEQIQEALRDFVENHQDDRQVEALFGHNATQFKTLAQYFATDLLEVGNQLREDREAHNYSLDQIKELTRIKLANANWGADTQTRWSLADKAVAWAESHKHGFLSNPAVLGAAVSVGVYGGMKAAGYGGRALLAAPGAGLLTGAIFAGFRRAHDLKIDRASHQAEKEYGALTPESAERRNKLDQYEYESATSFNSLLHGRVERRTIGGDTRGIRELLSLDFSSENPQAVGNRDALLRRAAEIRARLDFGFSNKKGLITFEGRESIEQNRLELVKAISEAKIKLRDSGMSEDTINTRLTEFQSEWTNLFTENVSQHDKAFNTYRLKSSLISAGIGGAVGLASGLGVASAIRGGFELAGKNAHVAGLGNIDGAEKIFGSAGNSARSLREAILKRKPVHLGNLVIQTDEQKRLSITNPDGTSHILPGSHVTEEGTITLTALPPHFESPLKEMGIEIKSYTTVNEFDLPKTPDGQLDMVADNLPGSHHSIEVPRGTGWIQDQQDPSKWHLVVSETNPDQPLQYLIKNVTINSEGELEPHDLFENGIFSLNEQQETVPEKKIVLGPEGIWNENASHIENRQWYGYDTRGSDFNELRVSNSVFTSSNGEKGVIWDLSGMETSSQSSANPPHVDVQEAIRTGEAGFAFSHPDMQQSPIWVSDLSDGVADGKIRLDPSDFSNHIDPTNPSSMTVGEFSRIILNQESLKNIPDGSLESELTNRQDVFRLGSNDGPGFIEAGSLEDVNGQKILQVFATAHGSSPTPEVIEFENTVTTSTITVTPTHFDVTVYEVIPPGGTQDSTEIPIVPITATPRGPLERMEYPEQEATVPTGSLPEEQTSLEIPNPEEQPESEPDPDSSEDTVLERPPTPNTPSQREDAAGNEIYTAFEAGIPMPEREASEYILSNNDEKLLDILLSDQRYYEALVETKQQNERRKWKAEDQKKAQEGIIELFYAILELKNIRHLIPENTPITVDLVRNILQTIKTDPQYRDAHRIMQQFGRNIFYQDLSENKFGVLSRKGNFLHFGNTYADYSKSPDALKYEKRIYVNTTPWAYGKVAAQVILKSRGKGFEPYGKVYDDSTNTEPLADRKDRLLFYVQTQSHLNIILDSLRDIYRDHPEWFEEEPLLLTEATDISGVGLADEPDQHIIRQSFHGNRANLLTEAIRVTANKLLGSSPVGNRVQPGKRLKEALNNKTLTKEQILQVLREEIRNLGPQYGVSKDNFARSSTSTIGIQRIQNAS